MAPTLTGLIDPYGLRRREPVSLPEMSLSWGMEPIGAGLDAMDLTDAIRQYSVGLGEPMPELTGGDTAAGESFRQRLAGDLLGPGPAAIRLGEKAAQVMPDAAGAASNRELQTELAKRIAQRPSSIQPDPEAPAQGAGPAAPQVMTLGSSSSTVSEARPDKQQVAAGQEKIDRGAAVQLEAAEEEGAAAANRIEDRNDALAQTNADVEANAQRIDPAIDQARKDRDAYIAQVQQSVAEAKEEVNPDNWWSTRGTGQKIAVVAAAMLGGFTEGFTWGKVKNRALDMIENAIDRDIRAQEQSINAARAKRGEMRGLIGVLDGKLKDIELSKSAYRAEQYANLARLFDTMSANSKDLTTTKKAKALSGSLLMRSGEEQKDFAAKVATRVNRTSGGHQVLVPQAKAAGAAAPDKKLRHDWIEQARSLTDASEKLAAHTQQSSEIGRWGAAKDRLVKKATMGVVEGEGNVVEAARGEMAMGIVRAAAPGPVSNTDVALVAPRVVGPGMSKEAKIRSTTYAYGRMINGAVAQMQAAQRMGDTEAARELGIAIQAAKKNFAAALRSIK